jgi:hypothetical protein
MELSKYIKKILRSFLKYVCSIVGAMTNSITTRSIIVKNGTLRITFSITMLSF